MTRQYIAHHSRSFHKSTIKVPNSCLGILHIRNLLILLREKCNISCRLKMSSSWNFIAVKVVTGSHVTACRYGRTRHRLHIYLTRFLEAGILFIIAQIQEIMRKLYIFSVANIVSLEKLPTLTSFPVTLTVKKIHEDQIFVRQHILHSFLGRIQRLRIFKTPKT